MAIKSPWWWKLVSPHRRTLLLGLGATILCSVAASWVPYWSGRAVKALELSQWTRSRQALVWMLVFTLTAGIGRYLMRNILIGLSRTVEREQREELYAFFLARPFAFFERQQVGDLMSRIGDDVSTVRMVTGPGIMSFLATISMLPISLGLMFHASPRLTVAVLLPFAFLGGGFYLIGRWGHALQQKMQVVNSKINTFSHEAISGERVVQAFGLEDARVREFQDLSEEYARLSIRQTVLWGAYAPVAGIMGGASILALVGYGGHLVLQKSLHIGDLTAFSGYLVAMGWPVMSLGWAANLFQRGKAGQERIDFVLNSPEPPVPVGAVQELPSGPLALQGRALVSRFDSGRGLGPLDLDLAPGGSLAIVGGIGSGKTILLQLLAGLRQPTEGEIRVDGAVLDADRMRWHWAGLGWVPQEAFLFSTTLRENLAFGRPGASDEELWEVAQVVCLDDLIRRLPQGLDTVVGERGVVLSGGERQRTALARALLRKPRLLLMDDALSAVDAETESRILENLRGFLGRGRVIQQGTSQDLSQVSGPFARLRMLQSLERSLEQPTV
ncbi:MAG: transporter related [Holophagaceae bacterium]|nr:transporter related [Holophagaceae bacterium]